MTAGKGAEIVFNTVGGEIYFQAANKALALAGRQVLIATVDKTVNFNILELYRGRHTYFGVDTLAFSSIVSGEVLRDAVAGFASGHLKPFLDRAAGDLPAGQGQGCLSGGGRLGARSYHSQTSGIGFMHLTRFDKAPA